MTDPTSTETIIKAMRILSREVKSRDGVANAAIMQAAERLEEQAKEIAYLLDYVGDYYASAYHAIADMRHVGSKGSETYYEMREHLDKKFDVHHKVLRELSVLPEYVK